MAKLPTPENLGSPVVPQSNRPIVSQSGAGVAEAAEGEGVNDQIRTANRLRDAGERIWQRDESVQRLRDTRQFRKKSEEETRRFLAEGDLSNPRSIEEYGAFMSGLEKDTLDGHVGRTDSRIALAKSIDGMKSSMVGKVASAGYTAQQNMITNELGGMLNDHAAKVYDNPSAFISEYQSFTESVDGMALSPEVKLKHKDAGLAVMAERTIDRMIESGAIRDVPGMMNDAMDIVNHQGVSRAMGEERQRRISNKITKASAPVDPVVLQPGAKLVHPRTGATIATGGPFKPPAPTAGSGPQVVKPGEALVSASGDKLFSLPAEPKTITLNPGQQVVDAVSGATIASASDRPQTVVLSPGQSVVDTVSGTTLATMAPEDKNIVVSPGQRIVGADGKERFASPEKRTTAKLGAGDKLVDANSGATIAEGTPTPVKSTFLGEDGAVLPKVSGEIRRQTGQAVGGGYDNATGQFTGMSPEEASTAADLSAEVERILKDGEETGISQAVNLALGRIDLPEGTSFTDIADQIEGLSEDNAEPTDSQASDPDGYLNRAKVRALDVADATGIPSGVVNLFMNNLLGQLSPKFVDQDVVKARQRLSILEGDFINAFNRNPRLPVWEQIRLTRIFSGPSALRSPEAVRGELGNIDELLTSEIELSKRMLNAPIDNKQKQALLNDIGSLSQFRARVQAFDIKVEGMDFQTVDDLNGASRSSLKSWMDKKTDEEIDAMDDEFRKALFDGLSGK